MGRSRKRRVGGLLSRQERAWVSGGSTVVLLVGAVVRSVGLVVRGRVRLPRSRVGEVLTMENDERMRVFRQLRVRFVTNRSVPGSVSYGVYTPPSDRLQTPWPPTVRPGQATAPTTARLPEHETVPD